MTKGAITIYTTIHTKNYGLAEIIGNGAKKNYVTVKFLNTGNIDEFRRDAVFKGEIRDKYAVTLCGVGVIGNIKTRGKYKTLYTIWRNMIIRCYNGKNPAYSGSVTVSDKWKTFEYFVEDVPKIDGWDESAFNAGVLVIDKDIKQRNYKNKIYSLETCMWLNKHENAPIQDRQQRAFIAISPDGDIYTDYNITAFGRRFNLERKQISAVLHKRFRSTKGWTFNYVDEEIV